MLFENPAKNQSLFSFFACTKPRLAALRLAAKRAVLGSKKWKKCETGEMWPSTALRPRDLVIYLAVSVLCSGAFRRSQEADKRVQNVAWLVEVKQNIYVIRS